MPGNIGMMSPEDLQYLAHVVDESFLVNSTDIKFKRISQSSTADKDDLFDEVPEHKKQWETVTMRGIAVNRPDKEIQDRYGTRRPILLQVSVSYLETQRKGWTLHTQDIVEYLNMDGKVVDYYIEHLLHDGLFQDTDGNTYPLTYSILLTDAKAPTK